MIRSFAKHTERVGYFGRLHRSRSIGRGSMEGQAQRMRRRLKGPCRGWVAGHIDAMAALVATVDPPEWPRMWMRLAA